MHIRMYDCGFGDCFRIIDGSKVLFVDFGIHKQCKNSPLNWKKVRVEQISNDIANIGHSDFLLSHYHYDHYSGLYSDFFKSKYSESFKYKFDNVYIPDVWNEETDVKVVDLLLLRDIYTNATLGENKSLISLLIKICHISGTVHFVKRGTKIQDDKYVALSPFIDHINNKASKVWDKIGKNEKNKIGLNSELMEDLRFISKDVREIVRTINNRHINERNYLITELKELENKLLDISMNVSKNRNIQRNLSKFGNEINIIFHNTNDSENNILFTGDADTRCLDLIMDTKELPLHDKYHVIKIPHHGTKPHYYDFTSLSNENTIYLIPNGRKKSWKIDKRYSEDANLKDCTVYCSCCDACEARSTGSCSCKNYKIIYPGSFYIDI